VLVAALAAGPADAAELAAPVVLAAKAAPEPEAPVAKVAPGLAELAEALAGAELLTILM
jgi:hypothetical protein